jgi:putative ABC transport system permease protein
VKGPRIGILLLARRSLEQHALSSAVAALSLALAAGLVMALFAIQRQSRAAFTSGASSFDAVLSARGSQLQIVLNSVFHLETSPGNLPWSWYEELAADPLVRFAVPYALGDSYRGWRIVGTESKLFDRAAAEECAIELALGRPFENDLREIVAGSYVAAREGLSLGSRLHPAHGLGHGGGHDHDEEYVVVGIAKPTNSASDRVLWMPIEGVFRMGGHVLRGTGEEYHPSIEEEIPVEAKEFSALLLRFKNFQRGVELDGRINREGKEATLAFPIARVMAEVFDKLGWMNRVLTLVAYLTVLVGAASILASLHATLNERRREFAILRALGSRRRTLFAVVIAESSGIALIGAILALCVQLAIVAGAAALVRQKTGVVLDPFAFHPALWIVPAAVTALGALAGAWPAWRAYRTEVAENLAASS